MAINTLDGYIAAAKQRVQFAKIAARVSVANTWYSIFDMNGAPGAGTLTIGNTTSGLVHDDSVAGYPAITAFGASTVGYISKIEFASTVACRMALFDRVFVAGSFAFNATATLASQPSFSARIPNADYNGLEIWVEQSGAATGQQAVSVGYTNQAGTTGRSTGSFGVGATPGFARCWQLPLQSGDSGVQQINTVTGSTATAGTFNVMLLRPLWSARIPVANGGDVHDFLRTGLPRVYDTSAFYLMVCADSTSTGFPEFSIEVANA